MKGHITKKGSLLLLLFFILNIWAFALGDINSVQSADIISSYNILKSDYPDFVNSIVAGGASETQIQGFLADLDASVRERGSLDESNFNQVMYESFKKVITYRKNGAVLQAMLSQFDQEINYTLENHSLHPNLIPLRNAVKDCILGTSPADRTEETGNSSGGGGGGGGISTNSSPATDTLSGSILQQLDKNTDIISMSINTKIVNLSGDLIQKVNDAGKKLEFNFGRIVLSIPPGAVNIAGNLGVTISANPLDSSASAASLKKLSAGQKLLGSVYDLNCSSEASLDGLELQKEVSVTFSYAGSDLSGIDESQIDVYYFDEDRQEWAALNSTVDMSKKTVCFTTKHFSQYAVIAATGEETQAQKTAVNSTAEKFNDLNGHWAAEEVKTAVKLGLAYGISDNSFMPDRNISRAEFAALLVRAAGLEKSTGIETPGRFSDVTNDAWYFDAVNSAAEADLVSGYTSTVFAPGELITREQMAVMISRALTLKTKQANSEDISLSAFQDRSEVSAWAQEGVGMVVNLGILKGRSADTFAARQNATRAEATAVVLRMYRLF